MEKEKISYKDLSTGLKIAIIFAYITGTIGILAFLAGFFSAFIGY